MQSPSCGEDFVKKINSERGTTVILTTHDMDDVEALCSRVMIIGRGKILLQGNLKDIRHQVTRERRLIVELGQAYPEEYIAANVQGAQLVRLEGNQAHFNFIPGRSPFLN